MPEPTETLTDWEAKTDAATQGPWEARTSEATMNDRSEWRIGRPDMPQVARSVMQAADADFIAVSRTAMPKLLAAVEAIRALIAEHERIEFHNANVSINRISDLEREPTSEDYRRALDAALRGSEPDERSER